jgi:hypothetical protein
MVTMTGWEWTTPAERSLILDNEERRIWVVSEKDKVTLHDRCTTRYERDDIIKTSFDSFVSELDDTGRNNFVSTCLCTDKIKK